jgi:hypothetical protein
LKPKGDREIKKKVYIPLTKDHETILFLENTTMGCPKLVQGD